MLRFLETRLIGGLHDQRTKIALSARTKLREVDNRLADLFPSVSTPCSITSFVIPAEETSDRVLVAA